MAGAILAAPAIGFTAIYAVLRFPNFAVASHATIGAFAGYCANVWLGLPLLPSRGRRLPGCRHGRCRQRHAGAAAIAFGRPDHHHHRLRRADHRAGEPRASRLRQRAAQLRSADHARLALRRHPRRPAAARGPGDLRRRGRGAVQPSWRSPASARRCARWPTIRRSRRSRASTPTRSRASSTSSPWALPGSAACCSGSIRRSIRSPASAPSWRSSPPRWSADWAAFPGAVVGALTVGIAEELSQLALPPDYRTVVGFIAILLVLSFRPRGILGARAY